MLLKFGSRYFIENENLTHWSVFDPYLKLNELLMPHIFQKKTEEYAMEDFQGLAARL